MPKPYHKNPRRISRAAFQGLRESLAQLGDLGGIIHDLNSGEIIGGNQRSEAFDLAHCQIEIGYRLDAPNDQGTVAGGWVHWQGERFAYREVRWTPKQCEAANIRANMQIWGQWDWDALANSFDASDLTAWGMNDEWQANLRKDIAGLGALIESEKPPPVDAEAQVDKAAELLAVWQVQPGDLWQCGEHRVICGDCTDREVVGRVMGGERARLVVTDPPYGVSYSDKNKFLNAVGRPNRIETPIKNDGLSKDDTQALWKSAFHEMNEIMDAGAVVYCFMPQGGDQMMMMMMMMSAGIEPRHELIWLKNNHVLGRVDYAYKHEPILYAWKDGGHKFYGGFQTSIIEFDKPHKSELHPTMKPVGLIEVLVKNSSQEKEIVFDPFGGSGTTMIACQNLGRRCRMVEIAPEYVSVILQRFLDATGVQPVLLERDGQTD